MPLRSAWWFAGVEWLLALAWLARAVDTVLRLREVPDLLQSKYDEPPEAGTALPVLCVIVPALNEVEAVGACLRSLLASTGVRLEIFAVNDRSTDRTGEMMEVVAREAEGGVHALRVMHIADLPPGWLGKPHALALAAGQASAPFLLFTDADALYQPDALARCLRFVHAESADHLVLLPTPIHKSVGERMMLSLIQALSIFGPRLWKIPDARAGDSIGVGCFNLLRREAYDGIGGFSAMRMEVLEDVRLGYLVKSRGFRQRVAFGEDLLRLHWGQGALGIVRNLEKNFFAICRYKVAMLLGAITGMAVLTLVPFAGLFGPASARLASMSTLVVLVGLYGWNARRTRISAAFVLSFPLASVLLLYAMARSAAVTLVRGGVTWRGTFYPLAELRRQAQPLTRWQSRKGG